MKNFPFILILAGILMVLSCQQATDPAAEAAQQAIEKATRNKDACKKAYEAINAGDTQSFRSLLADNFMDHAMPPEYQNGADNAIKGFEMLYKAFPDMKIEPVHIVAEGNLVIAHINWSGTFKGDFMGIPPNGKAFSVPEADIVEFNEEGKAIAHWGVQDMGTIFHQLGISPPIAENQ